MRHTVIETWACSCRTWPIITATITYDFELDMWKQKVWPVGKCGLCDEYPSPIKGGR